MAPPAADVVEPEVAASLVRQFRRLADLTQFQFAQAARVDYSRYVAFEQGRIRLRPSELQRVVASLPLLREALEKLPLLEKLEREREAEHARADDAA